MFRLSWWVARGSVVHADVAEQVRHGLPVVYAADGLRQDHADVHRFDLGTLELLELVGNGVGHHHLVVPQESHHGQFTCNLLHHEKVLTHRGQDDANKQCEHANDSPANLFSTHQARHKRVSEVR